MDKDNKLQIENVIPEEVITSKIYIVRGKKVMLDFDLAKLYGVNTGQFNQQVKRNAERFPSDFMFQLTNEETRNLISQFVISSLRSQNVISNKWGGRRHSPYAFTEHGVAMLSSVLKSERAVQMNIFIIRAFIKMRELLASNKELAYKIELLEKEQNAVGTQLHTVHSVVKQLMKKVEEAGAGEKLKTKGKLGFAKNK